MKKRLSIKDLFIGAWHHFAQYFMQWILLFCIQIAVILGFLICCSATLAILHYIFITLCLFDCMFSGYSKFFTIGIISITSVFISFFTIAFPIMYKQNALDAVFNRPMSGFDVNNRFFSYAVAMFFYWMIVAMASCLGVFPGLFLAQRWRFVGWYLLDHGGCVRNAFNVSWKMTKGYAWFLVGLSLVQWVFYVFCCSTIIFAIAAIALNRLVEASMYKKLHMEYDKDLSPCACEA